MGKLSRIDDELEKVINKVKIEYMKRGKKPPSTAYITRVIANRIKGDSVLVYEEFIKK